jgi:hypothetical protein
LAFFPIIGRVLANRFVSTIKSAQGQKLEHLSTRKEPNID